ncbi:MAG: 50S ribosomal protein L31 [Rickettsiales endosymbiont of Dermacentor nuttalli]
MAKKGIHPKYKPFTIVRMDGSKFETKSASEADHLSLDVDFQNHPAWSGGVSSQINQKSTTVAKFNKRFGAIGSLKRI